MFGELNTFFRGEETLEVNKEGEPTSREIVVAVVVLLLEMAHADDEFIAAELDSIVNSVAVDFKLDADETGYIMEIAETVRTDSSKIAEFIEKVKEAFDESQRVRVLTAVWKVVLADGKVDGFEAKYAAEVRGRLGLSMEQGVRARMAAEDSNSQS